MKNIEISVYSSEDFSIMSNGYTIDIPINASISITYNNGNELPAIYANDVWWDGTTKLDTKINQIINTVSGIKTLQLIDGTYNTDNTFPFSQYNYIFGCSMYKVSGTPTVRVYVDNILFYDGVPSLTVNLPINALLYNTNISITVSGGSIRVIIPYYTI